MLQCPVCGFENLTGAFACDNCDAELAGHDLPQQAEAFSGRLMGARVEELGVPVPVIVAPDTALDVVVTRMHEAGADCVLVVANEGLVGIFTDRDAVVRVVDQGLAAQHVGDLMTMDPVALRHDDTVAVAIHKMAVGGFRHLPIVEDGRPVGVVTARDVFRHLSSVLG